MYVGAYDAPVRDLASYRLRLEELALLGFRSVGLAIDWEEHPRDLSGEEQRALAGVIGEHGLELRLHPDLGKLRQLARRRDIDFLACVRSEAEPLIAWALEVGAVSICCDSVRDSLDETVAALRLMAEMAAGTPLKLGVENSQRGTINSPAMMNEAVERVGDARMGLLVDVGHINTTVTQGLNDCESAGAFLAGLQVPIWDTHIHNNDGQTDGHMTVRDPAGTLDMKEVVEGFRALSYEGPLNMECIRRVRKLSMREMEEAIVADRGYLEGLVAGTDATKH